MQHFSLSAHPSSSRSMLAMVNPSLDASLLLYVLIELCPISVIRLFGSLYNVEAFYLMRHLTMHHIALAITS